MISRWPVLPSLLRSKAVCALASGGILFAAPYAFAQSASQITPPTFRPPAETAPASGIVLPGGTGNETPPGAEALHVQLSGVRIEDGFPEMTSDAQAMEARLVTGKQVSGADIFAAVRDLEAAYARMGFILARVVLPPQQLDDGAVLRLQVIDGFIERIETKNLASQIQDRLSAILTPLVGLHKLTLHQIERRLLLAGDTPGVILSSTLAPGSEVGGTVLAVEAHYQPGNFLLTADNTLATSLGTYTLGTGFDANSVFGMGELVYARILGSPNGGDHSFFANDPLNRTLAGGVVVPLGANGLSFNVEATQARTAPISTVAGLQSTDLFERLSARLRYTYLRSQQMNISMETAFDIESDSQTLAFGGTSLPQSQDRLRVLRLNAEGDYLTSWDGIVTARTSASFGINALGARTASDALATGVSLSRQGADANFSKLETTFTYSQPFIAQSKLSLSTRGQYSFGQALLRAEQFGIANSAGLSTFDSGSLQGDSGFVFRAELMRSFQLPEITENIGAVATPYVFGAFGNVYLMDPTGVETWQTNATSYGVGLRINNATKGTQSYGSLSLEFGTQQRSDGTPPQDRFTILFSQRF